MEGNERVRGNTHIWKDLSLGRSVCVMCGVIREKNVVAHRGNIKVFASYITPNGVMGRSPVCTKMEIHPYEIKEAELLAMYKAMGYSSLGLTRQMVYDLINKDLKIHTMKTNIRKKELTARLEALMEHVQEVGAAIGNGELNYMTDEYRDQYAEFEGKLETLIVDLEKGLKKDMEGRLKKSNDGKEVDDVRG